MFQLRTLLYGPVTAALLMAVPLGGAGAQTPSVDDLVKSMADAISGSKAFTVHVEKTFDVVDVDGRKVQYSGALDLDVRRPNRLYVSYGDDLSAKEAWYDGTQFTLHDLNAEVYGKLPAKGTIEETLDALEATYGVFLPLAELISNDAYDEYTANVVDKAYLGVHDVGGVHAHHVFFSGEHNDWQLWIAAEGAPVPLKMVVTQVDVDEQPQQIFLFSDWDLNADLKDEDFVPQVPAGTTLAEFLPRQGG